jgi:hypothetical protein
VDARRLRAKGLWIYDEKEKGRKTRPLCILQKVRVGGRGLGGGSFAFRAVTPLAIPDVVIECVCLVYFGSTRSLPDHVVGAIVDPHPSSAVSTFTWNKGGRNLVLVLTFCWGPR